MSQKLNAGDLRHRITIQKPSTDQDSYGEQVNSWIDFATLWASVEPLTLRYRESLVAQEINSEVNIRVRIRYLAGVTADMRVVYGTRIFDILVPLDIEERHKEIHLMCKEVFLDAG